jgi:hypothetical protein
LGELTIAGGHPFIIYVPESASTDLKTSGGNINGSDIRGNLEGENSGGNIDLDHLSSIRALFSLDLKSFKPSKTPSSGKENKGIAILSKHRQ